MKHSLRPAARDRRIQSVESFMLVVLGEGIAQLETGEHKNPENGTS